MIKKIIVLLCITMQLGALTVHDAKKIGMQIWMNEGNQKEELLVFWSEHEPFPSLGIGHNLWFLKKKHNHKESFPELCDYLEHHGITLPEWIKKALPHGAPWSSRKEFLADTHHTKELRTLLSKTIALQTEFMIKKLNDTIPVIMKKISEEKKSICKKIIELMESSPLGNYALIDYLNFKGSGINATEPWGLMQVLIAMADHEITEKNVSQLFALEAEQLLLTRIKNGGPDYPLGRRLEGWTKRICTYYNQNLFR